MSSSYEDDDDDDDEKISEPIPTREVLDTFIGFGVCDIPYTSVKC